jgi:hypothetical protein
MVEIGKGLVPVINMESAPPPERGSFEGPSSYPQLCWWSLIIGSETAVSHSMATRGTEQEKWNNSLKIRSNLIP